MTFALVGTGQMGAAVEAVAEERGHTIGPRFHSDQPFAGADPFVLSDVDVAIDFSLPSLALDHLRRYCEWDQPAVVGTTGWYDELDTVGDWVETHDATLLYAPNFSVGVAVLRTALDAALPLLDQLDDYDAFVQETHHTHKADSPSGTATVLAEQIVDALKRKDHVEPETQHGRIDSGAVHVTSTRAGTIRGEHVVGFDSPFDRFALHHRAKSRRGFAVGAVRAAEWVHGRQGLFTLDDVLSDWLRDDAAPGE
ncbi:MAG: 4-hydroxy-tetrahydrodipicolinate reductase [Salinivenus sp.]